MKLNSEQAVIDFGEQLGARLTPPAVVELIGDVGTGKTTLTKGIAKALGVKEEITSPSFTISKRYAGTKERVLVHYDFYRLDDPGILAEDLAENLQDPHTITVVEWGSSVAGILSPNHLQVTLTYNDDGTREVSETTAEATEAEAA